MNAQDMNVPDPPEIYTAPPCFFKIEQRMKENRFKTDDKKQFNLEDAEIKKITKLVDTYNVLQTKVFSLIGE